MKFTTIQQKAFESIAKNSAIQERFYFTGGTALSVFHLDHRLSEDLDFFTSGDISTDITTPLATSIAETLHLSVKFTQINNTYIYEFGPEDAFELKIDFALYPYKRLEKGFMYQNISIDSMIDIGANKIAAVTDRIEVKDFADLFFILQHCTTWDLLRAYEKKFGVELDLVLFCSNLLAVESFEYLPNMIKPLTLNELKTYFFSLSDRIGKTITT